MRIPRLLTLAAVGLLGGAIATLPGSGEAQDATPVASPVATARTTALLVSATNDPLRVAGSDGVDHLEYDLILTNGFVAPVTLSAVEVVAAEGDVLLRLEGDALAEATQPLLGFGPTSSIAASATVAVVVDVRVPPGREVERLTHRISYDVAPDAPERALIGSFAIQGPDLTVDPRPVTVIAPPLRGDGWLAGNDCCAAASLHRAIRIPIDGARIGKPETFAIDWARLRDGKLFAGDGSQREQWFAFGAEVYAVADGTVVAVQEGRAEEVPMRPVEGVHEPGDYGGNSITLEIAPGVYAFYGHLQPDSITVDLGDQVTTGQVLARLGNTGNSTAPHLHFGLIDAPDPLAGESLPMAFDRWTLEGRISLEVFFGGTGSEPPRLTPEGAPEEQSATAQLFLDVADFG